MVEQLRSMMPDRKGVDKIIAQYGEGRLPVGRLAVLVGRDAPLVWSEATRTGLGLASDFGNQFNLKRETFFASITSSVVVDLIPLLTLYRLRLLTVLASAFEDVLVPQSVVDTLEYFLESEKPRVGEPRRSMRPEGEGIAIDEVPASLADRLVEDMDAVLAFIRSEARIRIIGRTIGRSGDGEHSPDFMIEAVGAPAADAILESRERGATLYAEDVTLRVLAWHDGQQPTFGTRAFIEVLANRGILNNRQYQNALLGLIDLGYSIPIISWETLKQSVVQYGLPIRRAKRPFDALKDPKVDATSVWGVLADFLKWLWKNHKGPLMHLGGIPSPTVVWTYIVLDCLYERGCAWIGAFAEQIVGPGRSEAFRNVIEQWKRQVDPEKSSGQHGPVSP